MQKTTIRTDSSLKELASHGTTRFPFQYYYEDINKFENKTLLPHWHKEFEFVTVRRGTVIFQIGNLHIPVHAPDGIFINTGVIHGMSAPDEGIIPNILFSGSLIAAEHTDIYEKYVRIFFQSGISHLVLSHEVNWQQTLLELMDMTYTLSSRYLNENELNIHICACKIWNLLFEHLDELVKTKQTGVSDRTLERLHLMIEYIENHYLEKITLADIAASASVSKSEAIRCFRNGMQSSPLNSVNDYRLTCARELLLTTTDSITDIAFRVGLENCSYFDRIFKKKFGITPRMMRSRTTQSN